MYVYVREWVKHMREKRVKKYLGGGIEANMLKENENEYEREL